MDINSCYDAPGVSENATMAEITEAYRSHAKEWRPDRFAGDPKMYAQVWKEIEMAPLKVRSLFHGLAGFAEVVEVTADAMALQREFIQAGIVPEIYHDDALHVALATVSACGLIVSWNFKHIVNFRKIPLYNGISQKNGYPAVSIHSPLEVIEDEVG